MKCARNKIGTPHLRRPLSVSEQVIAKFRHSATSKGLYQYKNEYKAQPETNLVRYQSRVCFIVKEFK
jgi:hypothetical protein